MERRKSGGETLVVGLAPHRRVAGHAVLPCGEPEKDHTQVMFAGLRKKTIDESEVILAFSRFDELPGYGGQDSVEWNGGEAGPNRLHVFQAGRTGIVKFAG